MTNPLTRHPAITAVAAATVDEISDGRMILGIGAGDRPLMALGMRPARLASLRASIEAIRELWSGGDVSVQDDAFVLERAHMRFSARPDIPIYVSASGPKTLELAGEIADGVILLVGLFPEALAWALEHVERGAAKAGRPRPHVAVFAYGAIDEDRDAAMESARTIAAWFPQTSPAICELWGLPADLVEEVRVRYAGGEFQEAMEAARLLPDAFVRSVALGRGHRGRTRTDRRGRRRGRGLGPRVPVGGEPHADGRGVRRLLRRRHGGRGAMTDGWRVRSLHHVAVAHGDEPTCEDFFASLLGSPAHTEEGPGLRRTDVSSRSARSCRPSRPPGTAWSGDSSTSGARVCTTSPSRVDALDAALDRPAGARGALDRRGRPPRWDGHERRVPASVGAGGVLVELVQDPDGGDPIAG